MIRGKTVIITLATILCVTAATSKYWSQAFSLSQKHGLVAIGILEVALLVWSVVSCRRPT